ncbi:hypothetical protein [Halobacillus mangrovi]|uniref:hypothetical protein n=1 Tax=Halobacillus mangrovi TaxID=402384 RepID=UPI003D984C07
MLTKKRLIIALKIVLFGCTFSYFQNNALVTTKMNVKSDNLPKGFVGFTIVHLSGLHNKDYREKRLLEKIQK